MIYISDDTNETLSIETKTNKIKSLALATDYNLVH